MQLFAPRLGARYFRGNGSQGIRVVQCCIAPEEALGRILPQDLLLLFHRVSCSLPPRGTVWLYGLAQRGYGAMNLSLLAPFGNMGGSCPCVRLSIGISVKPVIYSGPLCPSYTAHLCSSQGIIIWNCTITPGRPGYGLEPHSARCCTNMRHSP